MTDTHNISMSMSKLHYSIPEHLRKSHICTLHNMLQWDPPEMGVWAGEAWVVLLLWKLWEIILGMGLGCGVCLCVGGGGVGCKHVSLQRT